MGGIWISMPELEEAIGTEAARMLCRHRGGVPFYVPHGAYPENALARMLGVGNMARLCAAFRQQYIIVPNGRKAEPHKSKIMDLLGRGRSPADIALETGVTERYVRMLAASAPKTKQLTLPGLSAKSA
jgi:hypothetical protein